MSSSASKDNIFKNPNDFVINGFESPNTTKVKQLPNKIKYINNIILKIMEGIDITEQEQVFLLKNYKKYHNDNYLAVFKPIHITNWCNKFRNNKDLMNLLLKYLIRLRNNNDETPWLDVLSNLPNEFLMGLEYINFYPGFLKNLQVRLSQQPIRDKGFLQSFVIKFSDLNKIYIMKFYNDIRALFRILSSDDKYLIERLIHVIKRKYNTDECVAILEKGIIDCIKDNELDYSTNVVAILVNKFPKAFDLDSFIEPETGEIIIYFNKNLRYLPNFKIIIKQQPFISKKQMTRLVKEYFDEDSIEYMYLMSLRQNIGLMQSEFVNIIELGDIELAPKVFANYIIGHEDRLNNFFKLIENEPKVAVGFYSDMATETVYDENARKIFATLLEMTDKRYCGSNIINILNKVIQESLSTGFRGDEDNRSKVSGISKIT